ncbi:MAG: GNAT family N-acetyltransferase [Bryobacterales bacterium]|nr:GNAT family N-acetyltransferase [Bryobacterales bacterium]
MIIDATAAELSTNEAFAEFLRRFEACAIPAGEWTHSAHITAAAGYLSTRPKRQALEDIRAGINRLNDSHGVKTTHARGYHESLTRLWLEVCDAFLQEHAFQGAEGARALVALYGRRSDLHREFYSYDVVQNEAARYGWRPPDLKPIPAAWRRGDLLVSTNPRLLHLKTIHEFLTTSYWAPGIPIDTVDRCIRSSLPFGLYDAGRQVGFLRVVTDYTTYGYLADVFVLESHRGRGLSKWLIECAMSHPSLQGFRRWQLSTRDAHGLYERFGFHTPAYPERLMEILRRDVYQCTSD